ncbi:PGPGW domain-containing protein [Imhoffiella purpurea]|uniref:Transmembrane protein (PGPGW) n=1 Tax=Imhoffiella purpurea TaxID=1249627 RepID=W9V318_9GAMM|nr:PGPGW domain-containing protein [Imhoffiella purpurea]EXJ13878.1 hypothetical protein D779_3241 [Imhoffiella purpurea]
MIASISDWFLAYETALFWLAGISAALFIVSLSSLPYIVARIPQDYFNDCERYQSRFKRFHPLVYYGVLALKNLFGWILILAGLAMLILPGQGLLTILMGLILTDFPGKFVLERKLASNRRILDALNWLRRRAGSPPLIVPEGCEKNHRD